MMTTPETNPGGFRMQLLALADRRKELDKEISDLTDLAVAVEQDKPEEWSVTRTRKAALCLWAYFSQYRAEHQEDPADKRAAALGSLLHDVLEMTYDEIVDDELIGAFPRHRMLATFERQFTQARFVGEDEFHNGILMLKNHAMVQGWADWRKVLAVEHEFHIDFGGIPMRGFMDRVDATDCDGNLSETEIVVRDYKSSKWMHGAAELDADLQASVYIDAARKQWPDKKVHFVFEMLRHGEESWAERDQEAIEGAQQYVRAIVARVARSTVAEDFPPNLNSLCPWCSHRHNCNAYGRALQDDIGAFPPQAGLALERLVAHRHRAQAIMSIGRQHVVKADKLLKAAVEQAGGSLRARHEVIRISKRKRPPNATFPLKRIVKILAKKFDVDPAEVEKKISGVDHNRLSRFITGQTKGIESPVGRDVARQAIKLEVHAASRMSWQSYIDVRDDSR